VEQEQQKRSTRICFQVLNFSIAYGKTAHGLARDWKTDLEEAQQTVNRWYADRPEVRRSHVMYGGDVIPSVSCGIHRTLCAASLSVSLSSSASVRTATCLQRVCARLLNL
jgi:hypothetical protein